MVNSVEVEVKGKKVQMREPKVRDMRLVGDTNNQGELELKLIANLTGLTLEELDDLTMKEYAPLQKALMGFQS
ncbi:phage tail assembly protein [Malaciobacter halophilus]|nr:phage tail assembly protein [Malaciobacter halophilus]RYA23889.1 phage tail assembly protein [Malaciobacter halophilus]